ncbi:MULTISPECIES: YeiH family protein [Clostridium]|uniref:Membrane protein n=1 Tax=Clostridium perfringens TaxID=1502 RepID=A0A127EEG8_CLOPF|nr:MULTISPECIES: putative sulfate exporter family transporter [Clostridium]AMN34355.1 membrane protein [Clostridium perfringens]MDK7590903.1 putative sulfate exporter family transporter [Clostridium sp. UMB9555B]MDK7629225.1 putative sulfate exporter family transporter [Clostridium sp. UMB9555A]
MRNKILKKSKSILPGLFICLIIGIIAEILGKSFPTVGAATFAIFIGIFLGNTLFKSDKYDEGTKFSEKDLLNYSIVLMGASLNIIDIMALGFNGVFYIAILMTLTICTTYFIGRKLGFGEKYSLLMSAGNAVCGSSAIGSVSPVIKAKDSDKVIAITVVNVTGTILMILLPLITSILYNNDVLQSSALMGGILQSVGQVIGSAKFIGDPVVELATVFKIIRIIFLVVVVLVFAKIEVNEENKEEIAHHHKPTHKVRIPWFIIGFFIICILNSIGIIPGILGRIFKWISSNFEIIALAGIGMRVKIGDLVKEGPKAMLYGGLVGVCQIIFAISLINIFIK